jgi:hypothetical protein
LPALIIERVQPFDSSGFAHYRDGASRDERSFRLVESMESALARPLRALQTRQKPLLEASTAPEVAKKQGFLSQGHKKARKNATKLCRRL